jgi:hypothetical protein
MVAFAVHLAMTVALAGRLPAPALAAGQAIGALAIAVIIAGRPLAAVRALDPRSRALACASGLALVLGPVAVLSSARMSDAPAGSVVVFWMAGGWALIAALFGATIAFRAGGRVRAAMAAAGGLVVLAGVAGVVANWERPSSFSPLVRFPVQEVAILAGGALLIAGALALIRVAGERGLDGSLVLATATAAVAGSAWWAVGGLSTGWSALAEQPVQVVLAAVAWGVVCVALPRVLRSNGPERSGALLGAAPLLLSALIWVEQLVGVAGPQPMIVPGVVAGGVTLGAGFMALWAARGGRPAEGSRRRIIVAFALVPLVLAAEALTLSAVLAQVRASGPAGAFVGSWTLLGWESVAGVTAFALAALLCALALADRPVWPALLGLAGCAVWPLALSTPMHVLTAWLPIGIEQYYGTEYASIDFTRVVSPVMNGAVVLCGAGFAVLIVSDIRRRMNATVHVGK